MSKHTVTMQSVLSTVQFYIGEQETAMETAKSAHNWTAMLYAKYVKQGLEAWYSRLQAFMLTSSTIADRKNMLAKVENAVVECDSNRDIFLNMHALDKVVQEDAFAMAAQRVAKIMRDAGI